MSYHNNSFYLSDLEESDNESEEFRENESSVVMEISAINDDGHSDNHSEYDEYSLDSQDIDICEQICHEESAHFYEDKEDKQYYIGTYCQPSRNVYLVMSSSISPHTFYQHKFTDVIHYLWLYSIIRTTQSRFEIMQLHILPNGIYNVILKTFWLRIVQRTWKRIFRERQEIWRKRMMMASLRHRELRGRYPSHINNLPSIFGMIQ